MKELLLLIALATGSLGHTVKDVSAEWQEFQIKFGRAYDDPFEHTTGYSNFMENLKKIEAHNRLYESGLETHKRGVTQFTDWTAEEFSQYVNRFNFNVNLFKQRIIFRTNITVPDTVDWRLQGAVSEVKNQGHCGSCWSFAATGALEGQAKLALGKRISLSEQNLVDCATDAYFSFGCNGGNFDGAFLYVKDKGIEQELNYPYVALQGTCKQKSAEIYVNDYYCVDPTEDQLKKAVASVGPIAVAIESTVQLQNYVSGVFFDRTCTNHLNHAVLVVGYGVEKGQEYWLIKNSWGSSWGEQGYFKLARNKYDNCGVATSACYPILTKE